MLGSLVRFLPATALEVAVVPCYDHLRGDRRRPHSRGDVDEDTAYQRVRPGVTADLAEPAGVGAEARGC